MWPIKKAARQATPSLVMAVATMISEQGPLEKKGRLENKSKGHEETHQPQPKRLHAGRHHSRSGQVGGGKGRDRIRRSQVGEDRVIEDEKMGRQERHTEFAESRSSHRHRDDIGRGRGDARPQNADNQKNQDHRQEKAAERGAAQDAPERKRRSGAGEDADDHPRPGQGRGDDRRIDRRMIKGVG